MQGKHIIPIIWIKDLAVAAHAVEAVAKLVSHLLACVAPTTLHARIVNGAAGQSRASRTGLEPTRIVMAVDLLANSQNVLRTFVPTSTRRPTLLEHALEVDVPHNLRALIVASLQVDNLPRVTIHAAVEPDVPDVSKLVVRIRVVERTWPSNVVLRSRTPLARLHASPRARGVKFEKEALDQCGPHLEAEDTAELSATHTARVSTMVSKSKEANTREANT